MDNFQPDQNTSEEDNYDDNQNLSPIDREILQAAKIQEEVSQILQILKDFEKNYNDKKDQLNRLDKITSESNILTATLKSQYKILQENIVEEIPNFDTDKIEQKISDISEKIKIKYLEYNKIKQDFFIIHEAIICKDVFTLKIQNVIKQNEKQLQLLPKLDEIEKSVNENQCNFQVQKKSYDELEKNIFENKIIETQKVIDDIQLLTQKILDQHNKICEQINNFDEEIAQLQPFNGEQRLEVQKISTYIRSIESTVQESANQLSKEQKILDQLGSKHEQHQNQLQNMPHITDLSQKLQQTRQIKALFENHKELVNLYKRLQLIQEKDLNAQELNFKKQLEDAQNKLDEIKDNIQKEFDNLQEQLQQLAQKVEDDADQQEQRLKDFEDKTFTDESSLPENDAIILKKEKAKLRGAIDAIKSAKDNIQQEIDKINSNNLQNPDVPISNHDLNEIKDLLKQLEKLNEVDIPKVQKNIDDLEAFSLKSIQNQLNDDNKKSQAKLSKMKKNYEELQKQIDLLNKKLDKTQKEAQNLKNHFDNNDLQRQNEIQEKIDKPLEECDKSINEENPTELKSLEQRKKNIIANVNKILNEFNENNKLIKEANKQQIPEIQLLELVNKNKNIQESCNFMDKEVEESKALAQQINDKLDCLLNFTIPDILAKYDKKYKDIEKCIEQFDIANAQIDETDAKIQEQLQAIQKSKQDIDNISPLQNPSSGDANIDNSKLFEEIQDKLEILDEYQNIFEKQQEKLKDTRNKLNDLLQPLKYMGESELKQQEIDDILQQVQKINEDLANQEKNNLQKSNIEDLKKQIKDLVQKNNEEKNKEVSKRLNQLDQQQDQLENLENDINRKLNEMKKMIENNNNNDAENDPDLAKALKTYEADVLQLEKDLVSIKEKRADLKNNIDELKKKLNDAQQNPNQLTNQQIQDLINDIDDNILNSNEALDKFQEINDIVDEKSQELKNIIDSSNQKGQLNQNIQDVNKEVIENLQILKENLESIPTAIEKMQKCLQEMEKDTLPDKSADYWEAKEDIQKWGQNLSNLKKQFDKSLLLYQKKQQDIDKAISDANNQTQNLQVLQKAFQEIQNSQKYLADLLDEVFDTRDGILEIKKEMNDCGIPVNISLRKNELENFCERLDRNLEEFNDLKQADDNFKGEFEFKYKIKELIQKIEDLHKDLESDRQKLNSIFYDHGILQYKMKDFLGDDNHKIIEQVRNFKEKIQQSNKKINDLEALQNDLNILLIQQDIENAIKIMEKKSTRLKERLEKALKDLQKIFNCGKMMDGNTSTNEEEEFIEALQIEMPELTDNINENMEQIDDIIKMINEVQKTKNVQTMQILKKEIDDASYKVDLTEDLINKLENEIIEWNAFNKLCLRDEELYEIESLLEDFKNDIQKDLVVMKKEYKKTQNKIDKNDDQKTQLSNILEGITSYTDSLSPLLDMISDLKQQKDKCFSEFDAAIPNIVKQERSNRKTVNNQQNNPENDQSQDIYSMINTNCQYKKPIHEMLQKLKEINQKRRELEEQFASLKQFVNQVKDVKAYKAFKGDLVDELLAQHLNKAQLSVDVQRLSEGKYLFGTKKIIAKIVGGVLVIRVGGGYMSADEFIEQYGKIELLKIMKAEESGLSGSAMIKSFGDFKTLIKDTLMSNVLIYTVDNSGIANVSKTSVHINDALAGTGASIAKKYEASKSPSRQKQFTST